MRRAERFLQHPWALSHGREVSSTPLVGEAASLMNQEVETKLVGTLVNSIRPHPIAFH